MKHLWKRAAALLLALCVTATSVDLTAYAQISDTKENTEEENQTLLQRLQGLYGEDMTPEDMQQELVNMGLLDEDGELQLTQTLLVDGSPMTLPQIEQLLEAEDVDLAKEVNVDGTVLTLGNLKTMLEIERELARIQEEYLTPDPDVELTEEHVELQEELFNQLQTEGMDVVFEPEVLAQAEEGKIQLDHGARVAVTADQTAFDENGGKMKVTFTLHTTSGETLPYAVQADYRTLDGSAKAGIQYEEKQGTVEIPAGERSVTVEVKVNPIGNTAEPKNAEHRWKGKKTFFLQVSNPVNVRLTEKDGAALGDLVMASVENEYSYEASEDPCEHDFQKIPEHLEFLIRRIEPRWIKVYEVMFVEKSENENSITEESDVEFFSDEQYAFGIGMNATEVYPKITVRKITLQNYQLCWLNDGMYRGIGEVGGVWESWNPLFGLKIEDTEEELIPARSSYFPQGELTEEQITLLTDGKTMEYTLGHGQHKNGIRAEILLMKETPVETVKDIGRISINPGCHALDDAEREKALPVFVNTAPKIQEIQTPEGEFTGGQQIPVVAAFDQPVKVTESLKLSILGEEGALTPVAEEIGNQCRYVTFLYTVPESPNSTLIVDKVTGAENLLGKGMEGYDPEGGVETGTALSKDKLKAFQNVSADKDTYSPAEEISLTLSIDKNYSEWLEQGDELVQDEQGRYLAKTYLKIDGDEEKTIQLRLPEEDEGDAQGTRYVGTLSALTLADLTKSSHRAELYYGGTYVEAAVDASGKITPAHYEGGTLVVGYVAAFSVEPVVPIERLEVDADTFPEEGVIYLTAEKATQLALTKESQQEVEKATFPVVEWYSGDTDVASINKETGVIIPKKPGKIQFRAVAPNGGFGEPVSVIVPSEDTYFQVIDGGPPAIRMPEGANTFFTKKNQVATVLWTENISSRNENGDTVFTVELFAGNHAPDALSGQTAVWSGTVTNENFCVIPEGVLGTVSNGSDPAYTVRVSAENPDQPQETISGCGYVVVYPKPASVKLADLSSYSILDSAGTVPLTWELQEFDDANGSFQLTVQKNGETLYETHTKATAYDLPIAKVPAKTLKDIYTVNIQVRNREADGWSTSSLKLNVYNKDALKIWVDGKEAAGGAVTLSNRGKIEKLYGSGGSQALLDLERQVDLKAMLSINYADYDWGSVTDQMSWETGDKNIASINYRQGGLYEDIGNFSYGSYRPNTEFMMAGHGDGSTKITVTHGATGQKKTLDVTVETLKDKLLIFNFYPAQETEVSYTNGKGEEKILTSNEKGELALYEESGVAGDIQVRSGSAEDLYLGTIYHENLLSGEKNPARLELYPVNIFELRPAAKVELFFKNEKGEPYTGDMVYRGAVYKNGVLCEDTLVSEDTGITLTEEGRFLLNLDSTKFWTAEDADGVNTELTGADQLEFAYEVRTAEGKDYFPQLITVNGNLAQKDVVRFGESIAVLRKTEKGEEEKPFVAAHEMDYQLKNGRLTDVTYYTGSVGSDDDVKDPKLVTTVLWWGHEPQETGFSQKLQDADGRTYSLQAEEQLNEKYPFLSMPITRSTVSLSPASTGLGKGQEKKGAQVHLYTPDGKLAKTDSVPFKVVNLIGVQKLTDSDEVKNAAMSIKNSSGQLSMSDIPAKGLLGFGMKAIVKDADAGRFIDNKYVKLQLVATQDPTIYRGIIGLSLDGIGDVNDANIDLPGKTKDTELNVLPSFFNGIDMLRGKYIDKQVQKIENVKNLKHNTDFGIAGSGYFECEVRYDTKTQRWSCVATGGGISFSANADIGWSVNQMVGPVPVTIQVGLGGLVGLDMKFTKPVMSALSNQQEGSLPGDFDRDKEMDVLTTLRAMAYIRVFGGLGFDFTVVAMKIGLFGQFDVDSYCYFLDRQYLRGDDQATMAQRITVDGVVGIKLIVKVLFISYEKVLASTDDIPGIKDLWPYTWIKNEGKTMENWIKKSGLANDTFGVPGWPWPENGNDEGFVEWDEQAARMAAEGGSGLGVAASRVTWESRDYLERYERSWGGVEGLALDEGNGKFANILSNSYPYANPVVTRDGQIVAYLSDHESTDINEASASWAVLKGDSYEDMGDIPKEVQYCDNCGNPLSACTCCVYCGGLRDADTDTTDKKVCECKCSVCGEYPDDCTCEEKYCGFCALRRISTEELAKLLDGKSEEEQKAIKARYCQCVCVSGEHLLGGGPCDCTAQEAPLAESNLKLDGNGSFAVAAWERQSLSMGGELTDNAMTAMMNGTEITASVYENGEWKTTTLTKNSNPDLAPVVAARNGKAFVAWRATAGSKTTVGDSADAMKYDDVNDSILYRTYDSKSGAWSEAKILYNGTNGNVKGMHASMASDGTTVLAYTIDKETKAKEEVESGAGFETVSAVIHADGAVANVLELTHNEAPDENPQTAVADFGGGEKFVVAWYTTRTDENGGQENDIELQALNLDGTVENGFVESLSSIGDNSAILPSANFRFAKGEDQSLTDLALVWTEPSLVYDPETSKNADNDEMYAVKFCKDENGRIYLTGALPVAEMGAHTLVDHFDAYASGDGVHAVLLASSYTGGLTEEAADVFTVDAISSMCSASASYVNDIRIDSVSVDYGEIQPGRKVPVSFHVANTGVEPMETLTLTVGESTKTYEGIHLLPNQSRTFSLDYQVPEQVQAETYHVTGGFAGGSSSPEKTAELNLNVPDVGISKVEMGAWGSGKRSLTVTMQNLSGVKLQEEAGRNVCLAFYKDGSYSESSRVTMEGCEEVIRLTEDQKALLDESALTLNFTYDVTGDLEDGLFPKDGVRIYAKAWVEEPNPEEDGKLTELREYYEDNNLRSILFTDPVADNGGVAWKVNTYVTNTDHTQAEIEIRNLSMEEMKDGNLMLTLLGKGNEVLETRLLTREAEGLIQLAGEGSETRTVDFEKSGERVLASYFTADRDAMNGKLAALSLDGYAMEAFAADTFSYTATAVNRNTGTLTAAAQNPDARIQVLAEDGTILAEDTGAAACKVTVPYGTKGQTLTVKVTPADASAAKETYTLTVKSLWDTSRAGVALHGDGAVVAVELLGGDTGFTPVQWQYAVDGVWSDWYSWKTDAQNKFVLPDYGDYVVKAKLKNAEGQTMESEELQVSWEKPAEPEKPGEEQKPGGSGGSGGSGSSSVTWWEDQFWSEVQEQLAQAVSGSTVTVDAEWFDRMPVRVLNALRMLDNVTLVIYWNGGVPVIVHSSTGIVPEPDRMYYPLSLLGELTAAEALDAVRALRETLSRTPSNGEKGETAVDVQAPEEAEDFRTEATDKDAGLASDLEEPVMAEASGDGSLTPVLYVLAGLAVVLGAVVLVLKKRRRKEE